MTFSDINQAIIDFVTLHSSYAAPVVFLLALLESLAFLSLLVPATTILLGIGALVSAAGIGFWPLWLAGGLGGAVGYSISYWLGFHYSEQIHATKPFSSHPELVKRAEAFFEKYGALSVFFGHFVGPIRAVIPVVAGTCGVNHLKFEIANISSAFLWITFVLSPGYLMTQFNVIRRVCEVISPVVHCLPGAN